MVNTFHFPGTFDGSNTSYVDEFNRSYYEPYSNANLEGYQNATERAQREHTLLANAINSITSSVSPLLDVDADDDGFVDAVSFVVYGNPGDWADLLWPHRWALYGQNAYINGSQVYDYLFMLSESWYYNVGVLCHEFGHVLGAPDYYHYDGGGAPTPVGGWDVMASNGNPPQFPSAFTKWKYFDWVELTELTQSGTYSLNPLQEQENTLYKIPSPNSETEYFVLEYRKQEGMYDVNAPGPRSGLVAYRINTEAGNGNAQGPPDELYVYRPRRKPK
jgi:M6 family metalloprotease domain